jgi:hypothetical protein
MLQYSHNIDGELFDIGKRVSDILNQKIVDFGWWEIRNKWMAFKLADGDSDGVLYDSHKDAVRHCHNNEKLYAFICFRNLGQGARPKDTAIFIKMNRDVHAAGYRLPDPDDVNGGPTLAVSTRWNDFYRGQLSQLTQRMREKHFWLPGGMN